MTKHLKVVFPWAIIGFFLLLQVGSHFLKGLDYTIKSSQESPDGAYTVFEFRSSTDTAADNHAPYGTVLSLAKEGIQRPEQGYVIFAGYCRQPINYAWQENKRIVIRCRNTDPVRTQVTLAKGIAIETIMESDRPQAQLEQRPGE
ncbi:MAG TPA: hypothetical protein VIM96_06330 [Pseudomonadales bacterium]